LCFYLYSAIGRSARCQGEIKLDGQCEAELRVDNLPRGGINDAISRTWKCGEMRRNAAKCGDGEMRRQAKCGGEMRRHDTYSPLRNGTAKQFKFCNRYAVDEYASTNMRPVRGRVAPCAPESGTSSRSVNPVESGWLRGTFPRSMPRLKMDRLGPQIATSYLTSSTYPRDRLSTDRTLTVS
jgi:hypothetical protein